MCDRSLDTYLPEILTQDTKRRIELYEEIVRHLQIPGANLKCDDMDKFLDGISLWISSSNYKVSLNGLDVVSSLLDVMSFSFQPYIPTFLPLIVDRLADNKEQVRLCAQDLILKLVNTSPSSQQVIERLSSSFSHKSPKVKEELLTCIQRLLIECCPNKSITVSKIVPHILKLVEETNIPVRDAAIETLATMYQHIGEKLRHDLAKREISVTKAALLFARFDEIKNLGLVNDIDGSEKKMGNNGFSTSIGKSPIHLEKRHSIGNASSTNPVGVDEEIFIQQFSQISKVNIFSAKEFSEHVSKVKELLSNDATDWNKRVDALKEIRAWLAVGCREYPDFMQQLFSLQLCLQHSVKDLRSQVVREVCITLSYLSKELGKEFSQIAELVFPNLIQLIPNAAKVMATSACVSIKLILQHTNHPKLISILTSFLNQKSSITRKQLHEFLLQILSNWPRGMLEKNMAIIEDAIRKGINDADSEARSFARKSFWKYSEHFKEAADTLMRSFDASKQKQLMGESSMSSIMTSSNTVNSSINASLNVLKKSNSQQKVSSSGYGMQRTRTKSQSDQKGVQSASVSDLSSLNDSVSTVKSKFEHNKYYGSLRRPSAPMKLNQSMTSSYDEQSLTNALKTVRSKKPSMNQSVYSSTQNANTPVYAKNERSRNRSKYGVSQSQPTSRSNSPAARFGYITSVNINDLNTPTTPVQPRRSIPGVSRSREGSRDSSPNNSGFKDRRPSGQFNSAKFRARTLKISPNEDSSSVGGRSRGANSSCCDSDDILSETSSVCSDSSFFANGRQVSEDMTEILGLMSSGSWADRRDGLIALQNLISNNRILARGELRRVTEIFTRMFHEPHGKVLGVFLDTLSHVIMAHHTDLNDWLYVLLTRLLTKTGADLLASTQSKLQRALDVVRTCFPAYQQFSLLAKFLIDQTQSPNLKVKVSMLCYLHSLIQNMESSNFINSSDIRLAMSRIITWTTEPKSVDVRKAAQIVLISMHQLNQTEFENMMAVLPKTFQEGAERILRNRAQLMGSEASSPKSNSTSPAMLSINPLKLANLNQNHSEIQKSIKQTSEDIRQYVGTSVKSSQLPIRSMSLASSRIPPSSLAVESRIPAFLMNLPDVEVMAGNIVPSNAAVRSWFGDKDLEKTNGDKDNQVETLDSILAELTRTPERLEERKASLQNLMKEVRGELRQELWDEHFNPLLNAVLLILKDKDGYMRTLALRVLAEFLRCHGDRCKEISEQIIVKSLEAHKDSVKEVARAAEECSSLLSGIVPAEKCLNVLQPFIEKDDFPVNLAAIKMLTQLFEGADKATVLNMLPKAMPGLIRAYDNSQSSVRKSSVVSLVAAYMKVGEELRPYLQHLHGSKIKLLNVYIKRTMDQQILRSRETSKTSSPTSVIEN